MPKTIIQGFNELHTKLTPSSFESKAVQTHRASIKSCLESNFGMKNFFKTGSTGNGTSISGYSDTDYFASIPTNKLKKNSSVSLRELKEVLHNRFPKTGVYVDSPAVVCPFGTLKSESTEIVPADYLKQLNGSNIYDIPNSKKLIFHIPVNQTYFKKEDLQKGYIIVSFNYTDFITGEKINNEERFMWRSLDLDQLEWEYMTKSISEKLDNYILKNKINYNK